MTAILAGLLLITAGCSSAANAPAAPEHQIHTPGSQPQPQPQPLPQIQPPVQPPQPAPIQQVFFLRDRRLYLGAVDRAPVPLTDGDAMGFKASPDGRWVVVRRSTGFQLWGDGNMIRQLPFQNAISVSWRPGPVELVVLDLEPGRVCHLWALSPAAEAVPRDLGQFDCEAPAMSADGREAILISAARGQSLQHVFLDGAGETTTLPLQLGPGHYVRWLPGDRLLLDVRSALVITDKAGKRLGSISGAAKGGLLIRGSLVDPAGRWAIVDFGLGDTTSETAVYDLTTFKQVKRLDLPEGHTAYGWSADGRYFLTKALPGGQISIWDSSTWAPVDTGSLLAGLAGQASWSAKDHRLLLQRESNRAVVIVDLEARTVSEIMGSAGAEFPAWQ